jgi:branched-chain amino acid transport system substrate-binding protein
MRIEVISVDDASAADRVTSITQALLSNSPNLNPRGRRVDFLLGPYSSGLTEAAAKVAQREGALLMAPGGASTSIYRNRTLAFGMFNPASTYLHEGLRMLKFSKQIRTISLLGEDASFTKDICSGARAKAKELGLEILHDIQVSSTHNTTQVSMALEQIRASPPDAIIGCTYYPVCADFVKQAHRINFYAKAMMFTTCVTYPQFLDDVGSAAAYVLGVTPWTEFSQTPDEITGMSPADFTFKYRAAYGVTPPYQAVATFAAGTLLVTAIERSGSLEANVVAEELKRIRNRTVYGVTNFNSDRQNVIPFITVQHDDRRQLRIVTEETAVIPMPKVPLRIGVLLPMTGSWPIGRVSAGAIKLAVDDVNADPTLLPGMTLVYAFRDSKCTAAGSLDALAQLFSDNSDIRGIIGPGCNAECEVTALLTEGRDLFQISGTCTSPMLSEDLKYPMVRALTSVAIRD